jgi:pilus assembly protein Flp/PilA
MKTFINMLRDNSGAAAAEYALILAIIGSGIALAAWNLGDAIVNSMEGSAACITTQTSNPGTAPPAGC